MGLGRTWRWASSAAAGVLARRVRRARPAPGPTPQEFGDVMVFLQRLAGASGVDGIGALVAQETQHLTAALGAALLTGADMAVVAGRAGDTGPLLGNPTIQRVVDSGAPIRLVRETALLFVPVVHQGAVVGVLAATRSPAHPFTQAEQDRLVLLGPHLGSSLTRAVADDTERELAYVDGLTRLANRRRLDQDLPRTLQGWFAAGQPVAFAMVDVDHFKAVNDNHGHPLGDEMLRVIARVIARNVRAQDIVYRYGGEEFGVLLPGASAEEATTVAERIRAAVALRATVNLPGRGLLRVTVSVGVTLADSEDPGQLIAEADRALYEAKHAGRNRTVLRRPIDPA